MNEVVVLVVVAVAAASANFVCYDSSLSDVIVRRGGSIRRDAGGARALCVCKSVVAC